MQQPNVLSVGASGKLFDLQQYANEFRVSLDVAKEYVENELGIKPQHIGGTDYYHLGAVEAMILANSLGNRKQFDERQEKLLAVVLALGELYSCMERDRIHKCVLAAMKGAREKLMSGKGPAILSVSKLGKLMQTE